MITKNFILTDKDIGNIKVEPKKGIKNFNIRLKPFNDVAISVPLQASKSHILKVIERKKHWILEKQAFNKKIEESQTVFGQNVIIETFKNRFHIVKKDIDNIQLQGNSPELTIAVPKHFNTKSTEFQEGIRDIINIALKQEAINYLPGRTATLASQHNFRYSNVSVRNNKTRWGSCSSKGSINLNIQLMRLPEEMIDYVILHELCHTHHQNHGDRFKRLLYSIMPEAPLIEKRLKLYRTQIF